MWAYENKRAFCCETRIESDVFPLPGMKFRDCWHVLRLWFRKYCYSNKTQTWHTPRWRLIGILNIFIFTTKVSAGHTSLRALEVKVGTADVSDLVPVEVSKKELDVDIAVRACGASVVGVKEVRWRHGKNGSWPASVETSEKSSFFKLKKERNVRIIVGYYNLT